MDFSFRRRPLGTLYLKYTLMFGLIALAMFGGYVVTGHTLIWNTDALNQHLPLMAKYREIVLNWLHHPFSSHQAWSWQMGIGTDTFQVYSYYTIGDVFAYLALLFPAAKITLAYQVIIVLRMYCVGLAFIYFAQHFDFSDRVILAGTAVYMVNSYLLYVAVAQPMFTTTFMLFPLLVIQVERVLKGVSAWPLTGAFLWMLVANYYLAFVVGVGTIIYLVLRVATHYRRALDYGKTLLKLVFATVTSILLAAVLLVPELLAVQNSTRAGAEFANGLKTYPLYYYLFLPKQLINGGDTTFMFWSALGLAAIVFLAIVYVYTRPRQYPLLAISLALSLVMLLIPACGAFFNGMMSASNRWTLLIYLPLAMTVCVLLQNVPTLDQRTLRIMILATGGYLLVLLATYFFQNDDDLFVPVIFLLVSLMIISRAIGHPGPGSERWLLGVILANVCFNALYAALPYNGGFANDMLTRGQYQAITSQRYGGLNQGLAQKSFYRVNTISNNDIINSLKMYNDLTSGLNAVKSYYSLQNKYVGAFSRSLGNVQYQSNIPLNQLDDRTVLNNFLGVKYLFVQSNGDNATKIPAGYTLDKTTTPIINYDQGQPSNAKTAADLTTIQTSRYTTKNAFPLLYWQDTAISQATYRKLSATQKERALASGVVVAGNQVAIKGLKKANLAGEVKKLTATLISNRLTPVKASQLVQTDPDETYRLTFPDLTKKAVAKATKGSELHVDVSSIKFTPFSMKEELAYEAAHDQYMLTNPGSTYNAKFARYQNWRKLVLKGAPDKSFTITLTSSKGEETITQPKQSILSFFKLVTDGSLNLGYFGGQLPQSVGVTFSKLGTYRLKYTVEAEKLGKQYDQQVKTIQSHALKDLTFKTNQVSGTITTNRTGILTSSIPYSSGWTATVNGKAVKLLRTNQAFVGLRLPAGHHRVVLRYHVPGLTLGAKVSLVGLGWTLMAALATLVFKRRRAK
ncbi:YfhO family protein [Limosilactobacillus fermentum]